MSQRNHIDKREVKGVLPPKYYDKFHKLAALDRSSKSSTLAKIVKDFFDRQEPQAPKHWLGGGSKNSY